MNALPEEAAMPTLIGFIAIGSSSLGDLRIDREHTFISPYGRFLLDLSRARFPADGPVTIRCFSLFGGPTIILPPSVSVDVRRFTFVGRNYLYDDAISTRTKERQLRIAGFSLGGGVHIERGNT
jgi:hypothetical protein